ncbi:hypothetical protein FEM48_Zijuj10G0069500 [Ziziphus jujuba var. spinosa]|uniref:Pentatricopeptide repeat-containing protein At1g05670, mitochondrial n=1 Tax=Ziziphus jujuba var. spinosa TaxID=714518 RepID=A0A978ULZ4_ZIZJJ|nr:hypothetical protein FEM48_Zijuj10G0069500 [Ziziphus jujuba var. spinosa]
MDLSSSSTNIRPFPDYSPKKPTIRDAEFVHHISTTIKLRRSESLRRILKSYESKFRPDHLIWIFMSIKHDYKLVLDFFDWACLRREPSLEARCIVVQIATASKDLKMVHGLIREFWEKPNLDVSLSFTNFAEKLIYTYKDWGSDPHVFDIFFQVLVETGMLNEARNFFDKLLTYGLVLSVDSCNLFLSHLSRSFDGFEMAIKVFNEYPEVDVVTYSTIISKYCHIGELQKALGLIGEMEVKGLKPNPYICNSIILFLCKNGKLYEAEKVLREMMMQGLVPDNVVYTTLIDGYCKLSNVPAVYLLFDEMRVRKIIPDFVTYTAIIHGFCKAGKMTEADNIFHEMEGACPKCCQQGEVDIAIDLLQEMHSNGLHSNVCTYNSIVNGLCKSGNIVQAQKLKEKMEEVAGMHPDSFTYTTLMDAYCKIREMDKAYMLLQEMLDKGCKLTVVAFIVLMNGFCMSGMLEDGERLLEWMLEKGIMPNTTTYNSLMKLYCIRNNMRATTEIYRGMCAQGLIPDNNTYNILIKGHCKARDMKTAGFLHEEMVAKGFLLTASSYNALIKGFYKRKKFAEARELFEEMRGQGLIADREIYNLFVDMIYKEGNMEVTLDLCDEVIENCLVRSKNKDM